MAMHNIYSSNSLRPSLLERVFPVTPVYNDIMIICFNCNAVNDEAMNMDWTILTSGENNIVQNATCLRCEQKELRSLMLGYEVIILEESNE
jgi:hypothetical protein